MTQINLLPWREEIRRQKKIHFAILIGLFVGLGVLTTGLLHFYFHQVVRYHERRNQFLEKILDSESAKLMDLNSKKKEKILLDKKINFIISIKKNDFQVVSLLDGLVRLIPKEMILTKLIRDKNKITLIGRATAYTQITQLMESMSKSNLFYQPDLTQISGQEDRKDEGRDFQLQVEQRN